MSETPLAVMSSVPSRVFMIEDHDEAYYAWKRMGIKGATLVHIDAHADIAWFNEADPRDLLKAKTGHELDELLRSVARWNPSPDAGSRRPNIGNYICSAIRDGIVRKVYWVVPDDFLISASRIVLWKKAVENIVAAVPGPKAPVLVDGRTIRSRFLGSELIVCDLAALPAIPSTSLLDVDTDFFTTDHEGARHVESSYLKKLLPWMWPEQCAEILRRKKIRPAAVTIAYSVEGYFTPIEYKFLGDWLRRILEEEGGNDALTRAFVLLKEAAVSRYNGRRDDELAALRTAAGQAPGYAAIHFILSRAQYEAGQIEEARISYRRAISLDGSYRTRYNNAGGIFRGLGMFDLAERECARISELDPEDIFVRMDRGEMMLAKKRYPEAEAAFEWAVMREPADVRALYLLAKTKYLTCRYDAAAMLLEDIVRLDPGHFGARALLGSMALKRSRHKEALEHYKAVLRFGYCDPGLYATLSMLYLRNGKFSRALKYLWRSIVSWPVAAKVRLMSLRERTLCKRKIAGYTHDRYIKTDI